MVTTTAQSTEDRCTKLFNEAFYICYEDNPLREGWPLHGNNSDVIITRDEFKKPNEYRLIDVYLSEDSKDKLFGITEGFISWVETYLSGRTSLYNMLNYYTPERLEELLSKHEENLAAIRQEREKFVAEQNN